MGVPYMDLSGYLIDQEVIKLIPEKIARQFTLVPLFKVGNTITIAMAAPKNIMAIDEVERATRALIEPIFLLILGVFVTTLALAVFLPMWNLVKLFKV